MKNLSLKTNDVDLRYATWIKMFIDIIKPTNLYLIAGRGTAKSSEIIAGRAIDVVYDMPRSSLAFISDTYINLLTNILPVVQAGWQRQKFLEGIHYVIGEAPPAKWAKPFTPSSIHKNTISTFNGCKFFLKSLDRPSINAGISVAHIFGDEAKFLKIEKLNKALPTLRGDAIMLQKSHYYMGQTFCTDMPNPADGEDDWILSMAKKMDKGQIILMFQTAMVLNNLNIELVKARNDQLPLKEIQLIERNIQRWTVRLRKVRSNSNFFYIVSSLANIDILTLSYVTNLLETLDFDEFKTSVLSLKTSLKRSVRFYFSMSEHNFYLDGYNYDYYDAQGLKTNIKQSSKGLRYCLHNQPLEGGFDPGNMNSLVIAQEQDHGRKLRFIKNFYTLIPSFIRELADQFLLFFKDHQFKKLNLFYDRAANQYSRAKQDFATKLKNAIEWQDNKTTGWRVVLMSEGARNIEHQEEYNLAAEMFTGRNKLLPAILIDAYECKELKSSLEITPMEKSMGRIQKVKKSEKLALIRLPMESTNFSDAFKALICQPRYLRVIKSKSIFTGDPKVR